MPTLNPGGYPAMISDPEDAPAPDSIDEACRLIVWAAQVTGAPLPGVVVDNECTAKSEGDFVMFDMPQIQVRVSYSRDEKLMATWAAAKWLVAVLATRNELQLDPPFVRAAVERLANERSTAAGKK